MRALLLLLLFSTVTSVAYSVEIHEGPYTSNEAVPQSQMDDNVVEHLTPDEINELGKKYLVGLDRELDEAKAYQLFEKAASLGSDKARFNVALMQYRGVGGSRSKFKGLTELIRIGRAGKIPSSVGDDYYFKDGSRCLSCIRLDSTTYNLQLMDHQGHIKNRPQRKLIKVVHRPENTFITYNIETQSGERFTGLKKLMSGVGYVIYTNASNQRITIPTNEIKYIYDGNTGHLVYSAPLAEQQAQSADQSRQRLLDGIQRNLDSMDRNRPRQTHCTTTGGSTTCTTY